MDVFCDFIGEFLLGDSHAWIRQMITGDIFDFLRGKEGKYFQIFDRVFIGRVIKILIKLVRGSQFRIQEKGSFFGFAEFLSVSASDQMGGHGLRIGFIPFYFANQLEAACQIAPLIVAADLDLAAILFI